MMEENKTIGHIEACSILGIQKDRLHRLCVNGIGPARESVKITEHGPNYGKQRWQYKLSDIQAYAPVWMCRNCKKPIPVGKSFCSEECREICRLARKKRSKQANGYSTRFTPGLNKKPYDVICPICKKHHAIFADIEPDKWVYCPTHRGRRTWTSEGQIGRVIGCQI